MMRRSAWASSGGEPGDRAVADVVATSNLVDWLAVPVAPAYRLALLVFGQFRFAAELDAACFGACPALSPPCARAIGMDHSTPRTCGALRSASTTQFIANAAPFAPSPTRNRKFVDSPLEGDGFELLVPRHESPRFPKYPGMIVAPTA